MDTKKFFLYHLLTGMLAVATSASAGEVNPSNMTTFSANTPAVAAQVNGNFTEQTTQINDNNTRILANQKRVTGTCPSGQSMSQINADGTVACETGGPGSGLDADTLDGMDASDFTASNQTCANGLVKGIDAAGNVTCSNEVYFNVKYNAVVAWPGVNCTINTLTWNTNTTVIDNEGSGLNLNTGVFTAPIAGTYSFTGNVHFQNISVGDLIYVEIHVGGINYNGPFVSASRADEALSRTITLHMNAGDTAYLKAYACATGGSPQMYGNANSWSWTSFMGAKVF